MNEDAILTIPVPGVMHNDDLVDGDPATAVFVDEPAHGALELAGDGSFIYAPVANFNGTDSFTYRVRDDWAESGLATVTITVESVNDVPYVVNSLSDVVVDENAEDTEIDLTTTFDDADILTNEDVLTLTVVGNTNPGLVAATIQDGTLVLSYTANQSGICELTIQATDLANAVAQETFVVTVIPLTTPPAAEFDWAPEPQDEGLAVQFTDLSTSHPDSIVSWAWDFGGLGSSTLSNPTFSFLDNGVYTVTLTVTDEDNLTDSVSHDVTILDLAPTADFTWAPEQQDQGAAVQFTDASTSSPDAIVGWNWNFGGLGTSNEQHPAFTFLDDGIYSVSLTVTDDDGDVGTNTVLVTVNNVAPEANAGPDQTVNEGELVSLDGSYSDPGTNDTHTFRWEVSADNG